MTGLVVFGHGSRVQSANDSVRSVAVQVSESTGYRTEAAFLELGKPDLAGAVARLRDAGATHVLVLPYFLTLGSHIQRDLPGLVDSAAQLYPDLKISCTPPLDGHPALIQALVDRAAAALAGESR